MIKYLLNKLFAREHLTDTNKPVMLEAKGFKTRDLFANGDGNWRLYNAEGFNVRDFSENFYRGVK